MKRIIILFLLSSIVSCGFIDFTKVNKVTSNNISKLINKTDTILEIEKGKEIKLINFDGEKLSDKIEWSIDNKSLAKIDENGMLIALNIGTTTITVKLKEDAKNVSKFKIRVIKNKTTEALVSSTPKIIETIKANPITPSPTPPIEAVSFITGNIYDIEGILIAESKITAKSLDPKVKWSAEENIINGTYVIKNMPINILISLTVEKDGWTKRTRTETFGKNSNAESYNFGGSENDINYAIQNSPEINEIIINNKKAKGSGSDEILTDFSKQPEENELTDLDLVSSSYITLNITFNEPVNTTDVENNLQIISQKFTNKGNIFFLFDQRTPNAKFYWTSNNTKVSFICPSKISRDLGISKIIYRLQFIDSFKDKEGKKSIKNRFINFSSQNFGDFVNFSMENVK